MDILVIENEVYLAQKIVSRLLEDGHHCDFVESTNIDEINKKYDIILISTSLPSAFVQSVIKKYVLNSIILLLVSYISDETVTNPIKYGAKDYIMKPFMMDELVRKIYHYKEFKAVREELQTLREYMQFTMENINLDEINLPNSFPIFIQSNSQAGADKIVFEISKTKKLPIKFISLSDTTWKKQLSQVNYNTIIYLTNFHTLKKAAKENLIELANSKEYIIISTLEHDSMNIPFEQINITDDNTLLNSSNIMTINEYVKLMVVSHQGKYPDTELSKKLGISRKSLWEKRKKLGIEKKK